MEIVEVNEFSDEILESINSLLPELSTSASPIEEKELKNIIQNKTVHLLLARENGVVFGTLTILVFPIITGTRALVEDVVVSEGARGKGVGKLLTSKALELAAEYGAKTVDLTSRPTRVAANKLYESAGFQKRETNVYRYSIDAKVQQ